ncbi:response regulator receiver protein [Halothece sp. PCC 7418]|uniref:response regulator transcription factor n=1 Tax=Halothece sp. (strain PCC 7418) TaxID=65093 RepID=UPI0002A05F29|nr:response regulator [Halothece sp. PCC 7418]AFZ44967.1 response regulator receiver protein [Halothece sp. PCC 7418]
MKKALIVEDSQTDLQILSSCLGNNGFDVVKAGSHDEALSQIQQQPFNLIVLDVVLPDRSGFELCRQLKQEEGTSNIPVVICSTKNSDLDKFWGMKQGADAYITKPIDSDELTRTLQQVVK